jgi:hypothetical protein
MPGFASFMYLEIADLPPMPVHTCRHSQPQTDSPRQPQTCTQTAVAFQFQHASFVSHASKNPPQLLASCTSTAQLPSCCSRGRVALAQQFGLHTLGFWSGVYWAHKRAERGHGILRQGKNAAPGFLTRPHGAARASQTAAAALGYRSRGVPTQAVALGAAEGAAEEGLARLGGAHAILPELRARLTGVTLPPQTRVSTPRRHSTGCSARSRNWPPLSHGECSWLNSSRTARPAPSGRRARRISECRHPRACALLIGAA